MHYLQKNKKKLKNLRKFSIRLQSPAFHIAVASSSTLSIRTKITYYLANFLLLLQFLLYAVRTQNLWAQGSQLLYSIFAIIIIFLKNNYIFIYKKICIHYRLPCH